MSGFLKLQRRFFSHHLWEEDRTFSRAEAFLDLLQLAAYAHTKKIIKGVIVTLQTGELCASERYLSNRWKWSTNKVRAYLTLLEADGMVEVQKKREGSVIFLRNYKKYYDSESKEEAPKNHQGSTDEAPTKQIKEVQEGKEDKDIPPIPQGGTVTRFKIPSTDEVDSYGQTLNPPFTRALQFCAYYESNGWKVGRNPMKDWKAAIRTWHSQDSDHGTHGTHRGQTIKPPVNVGSRTADIEDV